MDELNLLFDLDGTLTDSGPGIRHSVCHALERCGVAPPPERTLDWVVGPPLQTIFGRLLGAGRAAQVPEAIDHYRTHYLAQGRFESRVYDGIPEALEALAGRATLYVATMKPGPLATQMLHSLGLGGHFRAVHGGTSAAGPGDDSKEAILARLLATEGIARSSTVMIGDRGPDMAGARQHGLGALGVAWGYGSEAELRAAGAQTIVGTPAGLAACLARAPLGADTAARVEGRRP